MTLRRVLIADNNPAYAQTCAESLEFVGYEVLRVSDPETASKVLEEGAVHVAIIDLRLVNDRDKHDVSGLTLAKKSNPNVPKIILTSYRSWEGVREALGSGDGDKAPAVSFVAKQEGPEVLLRHVRHVFDQFVPLNWNLTIEWRGCDCNSLLRLIDPELGFEQLAHRMVEFEDLLRLIFKQQQQISIDSILWYGGGRVAVSVFAFEEGKMPDTLLMVCAKNTLVQKEAAAYAEFAPKAASGNSTLLLTTMETSHYGANLYTLFGAQLESLRTLEDLYRSGPDKSFKATLANLFSETLVVWSQDRVVTEGDREFGPVFRRRANLPSRNSMSELMADRIRLLARQLPSVGFEVVYDNHILDVRVGDESFSYPDPTPYFYKAFKFDHSILQIHTPGSLSGVNLFVNEENTVWLTDFLAAGLASPLWNIAEVEAMVRFDWTANTKLRWIYDMERQLVYGDFVKLDPLEVEEPLRKPLRTIRLIRQIAQKAVGRDTRPYHLAVLLQAGSRLAEMHLSSHLIAAELVRPAHLLIAAAMICENLDLQSTGNGDQTSEPEAGIKYDAANHLVWIEGKRVKLRGQSHSLFRYFFEHPNSLCTRGELVEGVFSEKFDETNQSQANRLNTAMHRLRKQLEIDPENPRYLRTEQRGGYILFLNPE